MRDQLRSVGHVFVTEGDAETLLHAWAEWEEDAIARVDGMFAFTIWNDESRELVCGCDPFSENPFFWAKDGDRTVFASDVESDPRSAARARAPRPQRSDFFSGAV